MKFMFLAMIAQLAFLSNAQESEGPKNVFGEPLESCSSTGMVRA